jgi:hypothetical protein
MLELEKIWIRLSAMTDDIDRSLEIDVLAAELSLDRSVSGDLLTLLAQKLIGSLPRHTQVERSLLGLGAVRAVTISFEDCQYIISRDRYGSVVAKSSDIVRGIKIKTTQITTAEWSQALAQTLSKKAAQNAEVRDGLNRFILGEHK